MKVADHHWLIYNGRCVAYGNFDNYNQVIDDCSRAIEIKSDYSEAYTRLGIAYSGLGNLKQAIEDYVRAIVIRPNYAEAYNNRSAVI